MSYPIDPDTISPETWKEWSVTRERFLEIQAEMVERGKRTPAVGSRAPDFELTRLDEKGRLTESTLRLSRLRGRPVAIVFGSYT